jgi:hypothetical protein
MKTLGVASGGSAEPSATASRELSGPFAQQTPPHSAAATEVDERLLWAILEVFGRENQKFGDEGTLSREVATMADEANVTMLLCLGLEQAEQDKVVRLDDPISRKFTQSGINDRIICKGHGTGDQRALEFTTLSGTVVGRVRASDFLATAEQEAVDAIALSNS